MDLKEIGEAAWNFITFLYDSNQDTLTADKDNHSFRQKVAAKFTKSKINCQIKNLWTNQ